MKLRTALCDLLAIDYPILQSGMGSVAGPELVAEVSRAGGLGILAGLNLAPAELRERIREVRALTDRPFGVNLWLHDHLRPPVDPATLSEDTVQAVQNVLNRFRERLGLAPTTARPAPVPDVIDAGFEIVLEERPPVFSSALGTLGLTMVRRCHERGITVVAMVATVEDARRAAADGVDVVVAQGDEAGGHRSIGTKPLRAEDSSVGIMVLLPQVVDAVRVPVVAAGGIADGRGLVAALALGAGGVLLGTRFAATRESTAAEYRKKAMLEASSETTVVTDSVSGLWARYLKNTFITEYDASGAPVLPALLQTNAAQDIFAAAARHQDIAHVPMPTGQSVGLIHDLPGAAEVVETVIREAREVLAALASRVRLE
ncbi:MAG: NAD(P)H-dependent flavin oxidoreductase [Candidatus Rokuibacteriota bacterium]